MAKAKETNSVVIRESKTVKGKETYGRYKLFCTCGYTGEAYEKYVCPDCEKKADIIMEKEGEYIQQKPVESAVKTGKKNISFKFVLRTYRRHNKSFEKILLKTSDEHFHVKLDKKTGESYGSFFGVVGNFMIPHLRRHWDISRGIGTNERLHDFYKKNAEFQEFLQLACEKREVSKKMIELTIKQKRMQDLFVYFRCPALQYTPWRDFNFDDGKKINELKGIKNYTAVCDILFGHHTKEIRKLSLNNGTQEYLMNWGPLLKDVEVLTDLMKYTCKIKRAYALENRNYGISNFKKGVAVLNSLYEEKVWVKQLMKEFFPNEVIDKRNRFLFDSLQDYLGDIGKICGQIKEEDPNYKYKKTRYMKDFHDLISKDLTRLKHRNIKIPYKKEEVELETNFIRLAKDTHELIHTGNHMNICVGSYAKEAVNKKCTIFTIKEGDSPVVCLEVRNKKLRQAKMRRNKRPNEKYKKIIIDWAESKKIDYKNCYDMM